jgi:predicted O-linked N-acetylglucosamine transferase (SPINDLY family)
MHEQALSVGTPIVTLPGATLAGRFTLAMYDKLGIMDLVATTQKVLIPNQYYY